MKILKRILNVIEGVVFLIVSLCFQAIFVTLLTMAVLTGLNAIGLNVKNRALEWVISALLLLAINALACWEYFKKNRANVTIGSKASIIFMVPRAIDLIWNGSERISR